VRRKVRNEPFFERGEEMTEVVGVVTDFTSELFEINQ